MTSHLRESCASGLLGCIAALGCTIAQAQDIELSGIDVNTTSSRLVATKKASARESAPGRSTPAPAPAPKPADTPAAAGTDQSGIITGTIITGASSTVITSQEIERSPGHSLQDLLEREPGIQVTNLFGGVNGARSQVDMRGFGAAAASNTLLLLNGRRITDLDLVGFDLASIPRESIDHIEITRGNSGTVLYGDGAVGGVINIVTKAGAALPTQARIAGNVGSFKYREGAASFTGSSGPWSAALFSNAIGSDGYRANNAYRQTNGVGDFRYTGPEGSVYVNLSADRSHLGLPGARLVDPSIGVNQLVTDRSGATTPFDYSDKTGQNATIGVTRMVAPWAELILDGGIRQKHEQAEFHGTVSDPASPEPSKAVDTRLTTVSFTPRLKIDALVGDVQVKGLGGFDYYRARYNSDRPLFLGAAPIHRYDLAQSSLAAYWQQTFTIYRNTDVGIGARIQGTRVNARDMFDANAPGGTSCFFGFCFPNGFEQFPLDTSETNRAYHVGFEHRFNEHFALFGRVAQSFRVPNVDERVGTATDGSGPTTFDLKTQKSRDYEAGARVHFGRLEIQSSVYDMYLTDEIHFRFLPDFFSGNINLPPTRRYGSETIAGWQATDRVFFKAGLAYTRSVFREGVDAGNDVPLVSRWTGSVGVAWTIWDKYLIFDGVLRYVGDRRMDNDQHNIQPVIPAHTLVDIGFSGEIDSYFWSLKVQNLFNADYFDYAIASPYPEGFQSKLGRYNAYPQPGRTVMFKAGTKFSPH